MAQQWGDAACVGWEGTPEEIEVVYNLFVNYDARPKDYWGVSPNPPALQRPWDGLAYVYMPAQRLLDSLTLFFEVAIARETGWWQQIGEDPDDREWVTDGPWVDKMALQCAEAFIRDHISVKTFVPDADKPIIAEHTLGRPDRLEYDRVETLADQAIPA
jgi:hypothetical protein